MKLKYKFVVKEVAGKPVALAVGKDSVRFNGMINLNETGKIIGCPIFKHSKRSSLHIAIQTDVLLGYVQCENMKLLDLNVRGFKKIGELELIDRIEISDVIQGIFEYV